MEVNSKRNDTNHHLPCLSGLSQAPLIGGENNGGERLTPISAHSLSHQSPSRIVQPSQTSAPYGGGTAHMPGLCSSSSGVLPTKQSIFFPAPNSKMSAQDKVHPAELNINNESHKAFDLNMNVEHEMDREDTRPFGQDENYHLYHEPLDLDEGPATVSVHSTFQRRPPSSININVPSHTMDNNNQQVSHHPPPTPRSNVLPPITTPKEWFNDPQHLPPPPRPSSQSQMISQQRSPLYSHQDDRSDIHETGSRPAPAPFSDRSTSFRNDIPEDVYFSYVTLKSADHRSRSYHGSKNHNNSANSHALEDPTVLNIENLNKNLSSTSISELPTSPANFAQTPAPLRDHCIRELLETERNYVCALEMIITCFAKPLEILLKRDDNQLIFGHIRNFYHIHSSFQNDLVKATYKLFNRELPLLPLPARDNIEQAASNPTTPTLGGNKQFFGASPLSSPTTRDVPQRAPKISACFLNMKEKFLKYGEYCATLSRAQGLIDELTSKNEAIAAQLDRCQQEANEGKFKLRDLLSLPMQRILKYHLLLAQLIKNTSPSSDDYQGLKRAHEAMVDLGQYINEVKRDTEATQMMNEIEQSIVGLNMPPNTRLIDYGRLVTDGFINIRPPQELRSKSAHELSKIKLPQDTKLKQKRYVFVFDKVILMCKLSNVRRFQYKEALVLSEYELNLNPSVPSDLLNKHTIKDKWSYAFELYRLCDRTAYTFLPKTMDMKNKWVNAIQRAMDNTRPAACRSGNNMGHEFLMHTFEKASSCDHCGKLLLGLYYQGYRCRICFSSVHKKCLGSVRACGPALPPKSSATLAHPSHRSRCTEPQSPSVQANHTNNGHDVLMHFPSPSSLSTQGVEALTKNELNGNNNNNNLMNGHVDTVASSSFRENGARAKPGSQRPVSSMINVSLQNSTNQLIQQTRLLRNSTSTPSMSRQQSPRVKAIQNFFGDAECNEMEVIAGDVILLGNDPEKKDVHLTHGAMEALMSKLNLSSDFNLSEVSWLFGRNMRTGSEGRFPSLVVEQQESEMPLQRNLGDDDFRPSSQPVNSYINFPLSDQPWFNDRMDRDRAQALLEERPHGTFLVRVSPKHHNSHVISLKYQTKVMHMRIYVSKDNQLYLSQNRYFNSLVELVSWYQENSLVESFNMLDAKLSIPYKSR